MENILEKIAARALERVAENSRTRSFASVREEAESLAKAEGEHFYPFERALATEGMSCICEVKKASPSKGVIAEDFPYLQIAKDYEAAGASAISVLTEPFWFMGSDAYLYQIAKEVSIPVLRKDFTVDPYMICEAKNLGASAVLLICSLLEASQLREYFLQADELGLSALVEAHDEKEVEMALSAGVRVIGVNNRNLKDFTVDIGNSIRLRSMVPDDILFVSESGMKEPEDIRRLLENRVNGVLIGESLMRSRDKKAELDRLLGR